MPALIATASDCGTFGRGKSHYYRGIIENDGVRGPVKRTNLACGMRQEMTPAEATSLNAVLTQW